MFSRTEVAFLNNERVARISTIVPHKNLPHVVPVTFAFDGKKLVTPLSVTSRRLRNVQQGSKVAFLVDKFEEKKKKGEWKDWGLLIYGDTKILTFQKNRDEFMHGWKIIMQKYPFYKQRANADLTPKHPKTLRIMQVEPRQIIRWGFE